MLKFAGAYDEKAFKLLLSGIFGEHLYEEKDITKLDCSEIRKTCHGDR